MKSLYELLLKVGTNPQLKAWATKQLINLKHLKPRYKDSLQHTFDKDKVKDILDPKWLDKKILAEKSYSLKNKVLDITKAKDKLRHIKNQLQDNKDKFHGVTGQVNTFIKKFSDDIDAFFKKSDAQNKWFNDTLGKSLKGDKKAGIEIDKYFANIEKINREKVVPFWPRKKPYKVHKAEGGRIGFNKGGKGGIGDLLTELYRLSQIGPLLSSPELIDLIQTIPMAEGGLAGMLGERTGFHGGGASLDEYAPQLPANGYLGGSGQPNPQGGGGEQKTLEDFIAMRSQIGNGFYDLQQERINNPDYFKQLPSSPGADNQLNVTPPETPVAMQQPMSGGAGDKTQSYPDWKKASGLPGLNAPSRPENTTGPVVQLGGIGGFANIESAMQPNMNRPSGISDTLGGQPLGQPLEQLKAAPFLSTGTWENQTYSSTEDAYAAAKKSAEEQKIIDPYQQSESYKRQQATTPVTTPDEVRNKGNPVAQTLGAQPGALNKALGLAYGGLAGMLGEPRSGYQGGGYVDYWTMVQESFSNAGGQDATGMNIQDFAQMYFPRSGQAEGGRIGLAGGGWPGLLYQILKHGGKKAWKSKFLNKTLGDVSEQYIKKGKQWRLDQKLGKDGVPNWALNAGITGAGGALLLNYLNDKWRKNIVESGDSSIFTDIKEELDTVKDFKKDQKKIIDDLAYPGVKAQGGRIGLAEGDTPSEAYLRDIFFSIPGGDQLGSISFQEWKNSPSGQHYKDKWIAEHRPKLNDGGRIGYDNGGPTIDVEHWAQLIFQKPYDQLTPSQQEHITSFKPEKAEGGRIGFKDGEGIMSRTGDMVDIRNVPYYAGEGLKGLVNSAETLSKLPLAAGELGSKLLREKPNKEMFMEAIENITPGSWSENLGLTSLVEGMREKRPDDAKTVGGILGLGTEVAVPTGGAFKAGQLLLSKASKAMGKVKDGKTLEKLVDEKLTDAGQSRRDFNIMAATGSLVGALKWLGLGGILKTTTKLKPPDDVVITLKTFIDDSDVMTEAGPVATAKFGGVLDIESLSKAAQKTLVGIMKDIKAFRNKATGKKNSVDSYEEIALEEGSYIADALTKAGHKVRLEHLDDVGGSGVDEILWKFKNDPMYKGTKEGAEHYKKFSEKVKKMTERERFEYHNSLTDDYHNHYNPDVEELLDVLMPVKKAEGGRIGYDEGGWTQQDFDKYLEDRKKRDKENRKEDFLDDFEKWKKWKETEGGTLDWAAEGGRIGLQTGGPPISQGGLTKTIPPKRGPMPQGLPSTLYNGIMRPRSY